LGAVTERSGRFGASIVRSVSAPCPNKMNLRAGSVVLRGKPYESITRHRPVQALPAGSRAAAAVSTLPSRLRPRIEKPAGSARRLIDWRCKMGKRLILLPLMIVVIVIKVKVIAKIIVKKR